MNLLERTRRLLQGLAPAPLAKVQYYSVACPEGHRLRGERTEGYQALRCPTCGEGIFVLPRSPLPEPAASETRRAARHPADVELAGGDEEPVTLTDPVFSHQVKEIDADAEIEWLEPDAASASESSPARQTTEVDDAEGSASPNPTEGEVADPPKRSPTPAKRKASGHRAATQTRETQTARPALPVEATSETAPAGERLLVWANRRRNTLMFATVAVIVALTVGYRLWRSRFQDLPRVAEIGRDQGLAALDAGKFDSAHQLLSEAKRAVIALGDAVEGAAEIRQGADEAAIITSLVQDSLETILADASADPKDRDTRFDAIYKGRSIIIDANVIGAPDATGAGHYELDYRVFGSKRVGKIDLTGFRLFDESPHKVGDHVVFGARLESLTLVDGPQESWLFGLEPDSGVAMTHVKALEALGWPSKEAPPPEDSP